MFHSVADLLDATPLERELYDELTSLKEQNRKNKLAEELRDEQLDWALETVRDLIDLAGEAKHMRVGELRQALKELAGNVRVDY